MWCPFCSHENTRVVDSRLTRDGLQIRRRRQCEECGSRFNTYEAPEIKAPRIIKADGTREAFSEDKLREGMLRALEKRLDLAPLKDDVVQAAKFLVWGDKVGSGADQKIRTVGRRSV